MGWTTGFQLAADPVEGFFLDATASRPALDTAQPPIQNVPGVLTPGIKRPGREADHSSPSSAEVNMPEATPPLPQYVFMAWCLIKKCILLQCVVII
jgi:hypothetical protein